MVRRLTPRGVNVVHDMAIGTGGGIVPQIGCAVGVMEIEGAEADKDTGGDKEGAERGLGECHWVTSE
jgi:hypothetical protein